MLSVTRGDIFSSTQTYLCHQCNCVSTGASGLALDVFKKYPWANVYSSRKYNDSPGKIIIRGNGTSERFVLALLGQIYPGAPKYTRGPDSYARRERYFKECLERLDTLPGSFAFPYHIGCGLAGGDWSKYFVFLSDFATTHDVVLYKKF